MTVIGDCLVTGATGGLGAYVAIALAKDGWQVTGVGRKPVGHDDIPLDIAYIQADLANATEVATLPIRLGKCPDLVVHCAVAYPADDDAVSIERTFQVNAFAPYHLTRDLLALKQTDRFACFVHVNSEAMFNADEKSGVYGSSKAALKVLTAASAHGARGRNASVATLLLGPLANLSKRRELQGIADRKAVDVRDVTRLFLRKSNPNLVIDDLIEFEACMTSLRCIHALGESGNGMVCRLDGGAGGSLV